MSEAKPSPTAEDSSNEVKWQVALFALMPLVLTALAQPVGRVLDQPARYSLWMRSSPIVCAADVLHFLLRYADRCSRDLTFLVHFKAELAYRFRDADAPGQDLRDVQRTALVRWMLMLLGGIPCQTIKLAAMQGIPLTKAVAFIFFVALVFGEVLNLSASAMLASNASEATDSDPPEADDDVHLLSDLPGPGHQDESTNSAEPSRAWVRNAVAFLALGAEEIHIFVATWRALSLFQYGIVTLLSAHATRTLWLVFLSVFVSAALGFLRARVSESPGVAFFACAVAGYQAFLEIVRAEEGEISWFALVLGWIAGFPFALLYCFYLSAIWGLLTEILGDMYGTRVGNVLGISCDGREHGMIGMFLWTIVLCVLHYAYLFDGTGTYNPTWTGIFG